ncbi:putative UDP-rhamnose:rhamnosyltransferase 1 [Elaeis guineensis]|uniref:UDP-rhamnose:rhamnosyltransferase 1 n=1 Tax=Elaeis guineensis var. tenera TaxID=51953 RepID=A0A6I9S6Y2_ELAGV|nr:putative UDP-rhamnose:rhamnosyltransferase 1 [Elaeis guineensis]
MENSDALHVVVLPYIGFSHLNPFLHLSKRLAALGHRVSFLSNPANIQTIADAPCSTLSPLIHLVPLHNPATAPADGDNLDTLRDPFANFLQGLSPPPDWILFDSGYYWIPRIAAGLGVPCCYVNLVGAAANVFMWPFFALAADGEAARVTVERLTAPPDWIPLPTSMKLHRHEARQLQSVFFQPSMSGLTNGFRVGSSVRGSDLVAVGSCTEFEPEWLAALPHLFAKPVLPLGHVAANAADNNTITRGSNCDHVFEWLARREAGSVVYVAFGSAVALSKEQAHEIARGLDLSGLPFLWALRSPQGEPDGLLPEGFEEGTAGRGLVFKGWVPQIKILGHPSIGGFLTHCGWNSLVEAIQFGIVFVLLPWLNDQWFNSRLLAEKKVGMEVPRDEEDGSLNGADIAKVLRLVMVDEEGEEYRASARGLGAVLGNKEVHDRYVRNFVEYLKDNGRRAKPPTQA